MKQIRLLMGQDRTAGGLEIIEADETYVGGVRRAVNVVVVPTRRKTRVFGVVERKVKSKPAGYSKRETSDVDTYSLSAWFQPRRYHSGWSRIVITAGSDRGHLHETVRQQQRQADPGDACIRIPFEGFWSQFSVPVHGLFTPFPPKRR